MKEGYGGINVVGGFIVSSVLIKSFVVQYCGVWLFFVDKFEEVGLNSYQFCLFQIFDFFNQYKDENEMGEDFC